MRISKIKVHNYRSICDLEMHCTSLVVMLGPNNHGKSNILSALEFALSTSAKLTESDFFSFRGEDNKLWVEVTFHELLEQEKNTFKKYVRSDGTFTIRKTASLSETGSIEISYNGYVNEPEELWLKSDNTPQLTNREDVQNTPLKDLVPQSGRLSKAHIEEAQSEYIKRHYAELTFNDTLETSPLLGQKNVAGGTLPDLFLIPAIRDLADETKIKTTTTFGRLLTRAIREMAERDPRFKELKEGLEKLVNTLNRSEDRTSNRPEELEQLEKSLMDELEHWGVKVEIEVIPPVIEKIFELGTNLYLDDGVKTLAEQKGHGLQRAVIFALIRAWAKALRTLPSTESVVVSRAASESVVFAMEEPELFLHPHAQRRLSSAIQQISQVSHHQIFICTHSTQFVDLDQYRNLVIVSKSTPQEGTKVRQCLAGLFDEDRAADRKSRFHMAHWINPDRGEMFFAKRVIFVEGETEKTMLPYLAEKLDCLDQEISIIDCGSKHNLPLYILIANAFKIPYYVIHDEDPLPDQIPESWNEDKIREKRKTYELNEEIIQLIDESLGKAEILQPDFEGVSGISHSQAERKGKALAALDYFETKKSDEYPKRLEDIVRQIYCS
jgi:putative ATP-dependent endonuclease of OLD family